MNLVTLVGRLVRDPETQTTPSGIKYSRFTIAVDRPFTSNNSQADFIPLIAWRKTADFIENYLKKGSLVSVEGRFSSSTYTKDQQQVTRYEVAVDRLQSLESRATNEARSNSAPINKNELPSENKMEFTDESKKSSQNDDVPWDIDL